MPPPSSPHVPGVFSASKANDIPNCIKPYKNEALIRLRNSTVGLVALVVTTHILPLPSLWTAANVVRDRGQSDIGFLWGVCATELGFLALLILNTAQAAYALRYPRKPHSTHVSPAKALQVTPQSQKKRRSILSPAYGSPSPPAHILLIHLFTTLDTFASMPPTPSPSLGAYHARHGDSPGQPFDGLTLSKLTDAQSDEED
ncbi:hypothetical protein M404DRAFT_386426 [Pisolithus tinctorius Marx 270]|uniref:Uncharacterized protein n=1 Tax=Pisolithus tinctorius Marx 270 TaxID=870435 RepID=A0A0C3KD17_PISTI|nr:hypothetical protein M404DRAFT_386426 [Pisolithus tinctorius Marx 270]